MKLGKDEIIKKMEELKDGETLKFTIPPTFGGGVAIIGLNPKRTDKGGKKYLLEVGNEGKTNPYWDTDKPKDLAKWVTDQMCELA